MKNITKEQEKFAKNLCKGCTKEEKCGMRINFLVFLFSLSSRDSGFFFCSHFKEIKTGKNIKVRKLVWNHPKWGYLQLNLEKSQIVVNGHHLWPDKIH